MPGPMFYFILSALPQEQGQHNQFYQYIPVIVNLYYLTHSVNFPCGRKPEYPGKPRTFQGEHKEHQHEPWFKPH